jgi:hypothetical protein
VRSVQAARVVVSSARAKPRQLAWSVAQLFRQLVGAASAEVTVRARARATSERGPDMLAFY